MPSRSMRKTTPKGTPGTSCTSELDEASGQLRGEVDSVRPQESPHGQARERAPRSLAARPSVAGQVVQTACGAMLAPSPLTCGRQDPPHTSPSIAIREYLIVARPHPVRQSTPRILRPEPADAGRHRALGGLYKHTGPSGVRRRGLPRGTRDRSPGAGPTGLPARATASSAGGSRYVSSIRSSSSR